MAGEWIHTTIGQQVTLQRGIDITKAEQRAGPVPVISSGGISSYHDTPAVSAPGVILGRKGVVGSVYFVPSDYWPHDTTLWVKDFHGNNQRFVYYFFKWLAPRIAAMDVGSANPTLNRNHVHPIETRWPPVPEQHAIAHILGTLDDKIDLNRRMNETLEVMARALFKSWFVDFDPVRAKAEGRDPGLPKHVADLFPDSFEDSELGEIPKGWRVGRVGEIATLGRERLDPGEFPDEVFDHFSIPAFDEGRRPRPENGASIKSNKLVVPRDSVLLSKLNPRIPRVWLPVVRSNHRAVCSTEFLVTSPQGGASGEFLYSLFSSDAFARDFEMLVTGTTGSHQRVRPEALLSLEMVVPDVPTMQRFTGIVRPLLESVNHGCASTDTLASLRDTLLPKLISGELRVKDAERFVQEAAK